MHLRILLTLSTILACDAKLPRFKQHSPNELPANPTQNLPVEVQETEFRNAKTSRIVDQYRVRHRRDVFDSKSYESSLTWAHSERLDENGDVLLKWVNSDSSITFRLEAKTRGYVGLGFNSARNMRGADLVVAWVDDRNGNAQVLDCHGPEFEDLAVADEVQNYELISGYQNATHTTVEFRRQLDTCDKQDFVIGDDTVQVLWALGPEGSDGELPKHVKSGSKPLRLLQPVGKPQVPLKNWDVRLNNLTIPNVMATLFWCKIFKAPDLPKKHHIVGYQPIIDSRPIKNNRVLQRDSSSPVHHMVLYECAEDPDKQMWNDWADGDGSFGPMRPSQWATCVTPIAAWAIGSKGEYLPENVGIPLGEKGIAGVSYYMLEVHYDNKALHEVLDSSGIRVYYTPVLRPHDAALLGAGVGVSALHVIPPKQPSYRTVGICSPECTENTLPDHGINIVSVLLHAHGTARKISLKHVRGTQELPTISEENSYDVRYQQSRVVPGGRKFKKGDILITECTYDSTSRDKPILGGYSAAQEMCLSFVLYYPRTQLAGCYSMTPVKEFFETFGVKEFYGLSMMQVENIFLSSGNLENLPPLLEDMQQRYSEETAVQGDDQGVGLMKELVIREPPEFRNKTFMAHLNEMPWSERLLTEQIEKTMYRGMHMMFCKKRDDTLGAPIQILNYPTYKELETNDTAEKSCHYKSVRLPSVTKGNDGTRPAVSLSAILSICAAVIIAR